MLEHILEIRYKKGPNLPQGFQDSSGGFIDEVLVSVGGFCGGHGRDNTIKPGVYPRGFLKKVWGFNLSNEDNGWISVPKFPGVARQSLFCIPVNNALYCWGGFNYTNPFCYKDGYKLSRKKNRWIWEKLPQLPWSISESGICTIGSKIYIMGGVDFDGAKFYSQTDREGKIKNIGASFFMIDTEDLLSGWKHLPKCPGTPRMVHAVASVKNRIYVIGGATGDDFYGRYCTVVDNWCYNPQNEEWLQIPELPVSSGNFRGGKIVFKDRYIILVGGYQYSLVANPDGSLRKPFGKASRFEDKGSYYNDVFVYDTQECKFGVGDNLPLNNNLPMTVVREDEVFIIGGETGRGYVENEFYGQHPELFLRGKIKEI